MTPGLTVTTSWDDGHTDDLRLAELLRKYNLPGTFYIAPHDREFAPEERLADDQVRQLAAHFEIGAHTMTHPRLTMVSIDEAAREITESKTYLERVLSKPVTSFCYPGGAYGPQHLPIVAQAGFKLARTVKRFQFDTGQPHEVPTTVHAYRHWSDCWQLARLAGFRPLRTLRHILHWDQAAIALFEQARRRGGVFHLWGHSWEITAHGDWERLERVLQHISNQPDARYVTNGALLP